MALLALAVYAAACVALCIAGPHPPPFDTIGGEWVGVFASGPADEPNYFDPRPR